MEIVESSLLELRNVVIAILTKVPSLSTIKSLRLLKGTPEGSFARTLKMFLLWPGL